MVTVSDGPWLSSSLQDQTSRSEAESINASSLLNFMFLGFEFTQEPGN